MSVSTNIQEVVPADRFRLITIQNELRVAGIRSGNKELCQIANAIDIARYWESFQDAYAYSDDQVAVAQELHIASRDLDSKNFVESAMPIILKIMVLEDVAQLAIK